MEWDCKYLKKVAKSGIVLDVGANIGQCSIKALEYGAKKIYAIEANPQLIEQFKTNTKNKAHITNRAIYNETGKNLNLVNRCNDPTAFYLRGIKWRPRFNKYPMSVPPLPSHSIRTTTITFKDWLSSLNLMEKIQKVKYLKVDIEGSEKFMIQDLIDLLETFSKDLIIHFTVHETLMNEKEYKDMNILINEHFIIVEYKLDPIYEHEFILKPKKSV